MLKPAKQHVEQGKAVARSFVSDCRGQTGGVGDGVEVVTTLMVTTLVTAFLVPLAVDELVAIDTSAWSDGASEVWGLLQLALVLSVVLFMLGYVTAQG